MATETNISAYERVLSKYLPKEFVPYVVELLLKHRVRFKIVSPRSTKLGDFRPGSDQRLPQITINGNLNPYSFLITTLHEFAHHTTFEKYANKVAPHGQEWKQEFQVLLTPILLDSNFPVTIKSVLEKSIKNLKASSCSDIHLSRELAKFDVLDEDYFLLEALPHGGQFLLQNKIFYKGDLRRKRFLCTEKITQKKYLVSAIAKVKLV